MRIVADTSVVNYLIMLHQDTLLPLFYDRVVIPPAVHGELQHPRTPMVVRAWVANPPPWFEVQQPRQRLEAEQFPKLGAGEREAIALAQELQVPLLLMDDPDGREEATRRALRTTGTLGILEQAAIRELLDLPSVLTQLLTTTTFRARAELIQDLLARDAARKSRARQLTAVDAIPPCLRVVRHSLLLQLHDLPSQHRKSSPPQTAAPFH